MPTAPAEDSAVLALEPQLEGFDLSASWQAADRDRPETPLLLRVQCAMGLNPNEVVTTIDAFSEQLSADGQAPYAIIELGEPGVISRLVTGRFTDDLGGVVEEFDGKVLADDGGKGH